MKYIIIFIINYKYLSYGFKSYFLSNKKLKGNELLKFWPKLSNLIASLFKMKIDQ